ncbi:M20/M25/M40 family metallo-hydrolase [Spirochaeta isovalerica]|uniref:Arginine utilization protein RocB n=1 Tax=Spirochaeta isovalerica TaxID=150 RepID=A0A841RFP4_9SPIO|nr:M20/M25/M40 family metallo-hydrolase [Spirochaeta isovalerica]MBB6481388.1 arginine utilization protein RocB [Spirochaeta isovalerica]
MRPAENWKKIIEPLFLRLISSRSDTNTPFEGFIEEIILNWLKSRPYFKEHPHHLGSRKLENDNNNREIIWSLVEGVSKKTIVFLHHHDAVGTSDYGKLENLALRPDSLREALAKRPLSPAVSKDLESGDWLFGRGAADMKAGAAIQMALMDKLSTDETFSHTLLLISVPDEENLSRGMIEATGLLVDLKKTYNLDYKLVINSEPYYNQTSKKALMYEGSVGKIMPIVYVRGVRSHIGDPFNGLNPSLILARIQALTELNIDLCDQFGNDATPPPIWVNLKDRKKNYDASIPEAATGYFNWLTFTKTPVDILESMIHLSEEAVQSVLSHFEESYKKFCLLNHDEPDAISFTPLVIDYEKLYKQALLKGENLFLEKLAAKEEEMKILLGENKITLPDAAIRILEFTADEADLEGPAVVIGLSGPYYPHITNSMIKGGEDFNLAERVDRISKELFQIEYQSNAYFMGISDLSYAGWVGNEEDIVSIKRNSPGWETIYSVPFRKMEQLDAPIVNIGPWGKDLHKPTERVNIKDVYERIPSILDRLIREILPPEKNQT